jgi:AhpD family alkylhydroperoxidase
MRLNIQQIAPEAYKAMFGLEKYLNGSQLSPAHRHLIKLRASQINGCAYCVNMHSREARQHGETEQRLYLLPVWRETTLFTAEERALLALTEEVTLIGQHVSDATYEAALALFGEQYLAHAIMAIVTINAWNRIGVTTQLQIEA